MSNIVLAHDPAGKQLYSLHTVVTLLIFPFIIHLYA